MSQDKQKLPLISIIIPFYNSRFNFFTEAIESVLAQSYTNWEVIIVNDGSSIKNKNLLEKYINKINDKRISIFHFDKNIGPAAARNKGIDLAYGELITFLDADDILLPWYCHRILDFFSTNPNNSILFSHCFFYLNIWNLKKMWTNESFLKPLNYESEKNIQKYTILDIKKIGDIVPSRIFKKEILKKILFDPALKALEDAELDLQITNNKELLNNLIFVQPIGYLYRLYPSPNRVCNKTDAGVKAKVEIINKYQDKNTLPYKIIQHWQNQYNTWKFSKTINDYLNTKCISKYLKDAFLISKSLKDKLRNLKFLITTLIDINFTMPVLGFDLQDLQILFLKEENNKYKKIKEEFKRYINTYNNEKQYVYASKTFSKIFIK